MKHIILLLCCLFFSFVCYSQSCADTVMKKVISSDSFKNWNLHTYADISKNGKYMYVINESFSPPFERYLMIRELNGDRMAKFKCIGTPIFSSNELFFFQLSPDSLGVLALDNFKLSFIPNVKVFWIHEKYLIYRSVRPDRFVITDLITQNSKSFLNVIDFHFSGDGKLLVIESQINNSTQSLMLLDLNANKMLRVWEGEALEFFVVDHTGQQVAFVVNDSLWIYNRHDSLPIRLVSGSDDYFISKLVGFSRDGTRIFINIVDNRCMSPSPPKAILNLWSYSMSRLPSQFNQDLKPKSFLAVIDPLNRQLHQLEFSDEAVYFSGYDRLVDTVCLVYKSDNDSVGYSNEVSNGWALMNTKTGLRRQLMFAKNATFVVLSRGGKYVIYYDKVVKSYFSYEIASEKLRNITSGMKVLWEKNVDKGIYGYKYICGWITGDRGLLIYSQEDIWQIDPAGIGRPIRLTNGYGNRHQLKFFLALEEYGHRFIGERESLILTAFSPQTKKNGFYKLTVGREKNPDSLTMGAHLYCISENPWIPSYLNFSPIKARGSRKYIVRRMSATEAPNYYVTVDFKSFLKITDAEPHKQYNWYMTTLHSWKSLDSSWLQGILYKPESFDSTRKYPLIISCYERMSDRLNAYILPEPLTGGNTINIPYYVSNGYLIFCPDINYKIGDPMEGAYNSIISAVKYLSELPYVDIKRIGIQGSSWGAIQTNYLVTHTDVFAAACSASGLSDWISGYGSLMADGISAQEMYEKGQLRIGATLWEKREIYIKNSSVLNADKITTPLLMMHTRNDELCSFGNALELFMALHRLKRRSWLLEYKGNHTLFGEEAKDFSMRMKEFFDHYLMDKPMPGWMSQSVSGRNQLPNCKIEYGGKKDLETFVSK
ncbi:alpha/beta hydrolase family protein [Chitinophaga polysaccharea]|uniref:alpha/beta hydrolase family protein n=1 Tax=Chitinophaga polysaccharea TaxID=1293035 RepID=UPI00115A8945|nr:prolyl oligopeptidase family serine peptidase [Chitinophaga polysaccharea]